MIDKIQQALSEADLDGWLFYSFRGSDPIAANILGLATEGHMATRRWFYLIPRAGEPTKIVHSIERDVIDALPGQEAGLFALATTPRAAQDLARAR